MEILKIQEYIEKITKVQSAVLTYIESDEDEEVNHQNLNKLINDNKILENRYEFKLYLRLLFSILNNHHRTPNLLNKIDKLLLSYKDKIKQTFSNTEIFDIFKDNKKILLFLIKNEIVQIDKSIFSTIKANSKYTNENYLQYFSIEFKPFSENDSVETKDDKFEENRSNGENDSDICELIRNDSLEEFKSKVNQNNISLNSLIKPSIFETNQFLLKQKETTLIEYSAFFGSMQIFNYLKENNVELTSSLWLYSIHSNNEELIHLLVENHVEPKDKTYQECVKESIKCHHNKIANYIKDNLLDKQVEKENLKSNFKCNILAYAYHYYNFAFIAANLIHRFYFYYASKYDYYTLVTLLLKINGFDINMKIIQTSSFF